MVVFVDELVLPHGPLELGDQDRFLGDLGVRAPGLVIHHFHYLVFRLNQLSHHTSDLGLQHHVFLDQVVLHQLLVHGIILEGLDVMPVFWGLWSLQDLHLLQFVRSVASRIPERRAHSLGLVDRYISLALPFSRP